MHRLPVELCGSLNPLRRSEAPVGGTRAHTQIQSRDSLGAGHAAVAALCWTLREGPGPRSHPGSPGNAPAAGETSPPAPWKRSR